MRCDDAHATNFVHTLEQALCSYPFVMQALIEGEPGRRDTSTTVASPVRSRWNNAPLRALVAIDPRAAVSAEGMLRHVASRVRPEWVPTEIAFVSSVGSDLVRAPA